MFPDTSSRKLFRCFSIPILILSAIVLYPGDSMAENPDSFSNPIACRFASYGKFQDEAWDHLPSIGVEYVFLNVPKPDEVDATIQKLSEHHLTPLVIRGDTDLSQPSSVEELGEQCAICERMGVRYMFLSPKRHGATKEVIYDRLRKVGDLAQKHGVTVALETHPDLGTNGDVHLETMKAIDHPHIRVNFDTANITYYNQDADACAELEKIVDYVGTVELKDHNLEFETWNFPVLGEGKANFPCILEVLKKNDYQGPITLEFEGIKGVELNRQETLAAIEKSVRYARTLLGRPEKKPE